MVSIALIISGYRTSLALSTYQGGTDNSVQYLNISSSENCSAFAERSDKRSVRIAGMIGDLQQRKFDICAVNVFPTEDLRVSIRPLSLYNLKNCLVVNQF